MEYKGEDANLLPYNATTHISIKIIGGIGIIIYLFTLSSPLLILQTWLTGNWVLRAGMVFYYCIVPIGILSMFLTRTTFTENHITRRNFLGASRCKQYEAITKIENEGRYIKIIFCDGHSFKVWSGEANLIKVLQILRLKTAKTA